MRDQPGGDQMIAFIPGECTPTRVDDERGGNQREDCRYGNGGSFWLTIV